MKDIKIKTPYGDKNWSFVKKCLDSNDYLLEACKFAYNELSAGKELKNYVLLMDKIKQAINKAEGNN